MITDIECIHYSYPIAEARQLTEPLRWASFLSLNHVHHQSCLNLAPILS